MTRWVAGVWAGVLAAGLSAAQEPPPNRGDDALNRKVIDYCKQSLGKQVGDGECASLAVAALREAGAKSLGAYKDSPNEGDYVWGELVYALEIKPGLRTESTPIGTTVKAGDVIQFRDATFSGRRPGGAIYTMNAPHHTAVVLNVSKDGKVITTLEQNANGRKTVAEGSVRLNDLQSGWVKVYRPQK